MRGRIVILVGTAALAVVASLLVVAITKVRQAESCSHSVNNLRQISLSLFSYHDAFKRLPPHSKFSKDGKATLYSWRLEILPFIESRMGLPSLFNADEPWDSEFNLKPLAAEYHLYSAPGIGMKGQGLTYYQVFTGPHTMFDGTKRFSMSEILDGQAATILIAEAGDPVIWTKPADMVLPRGSDDMPAVGGVFKAGTHAVFCDGSVRFLRRDMSSAVLRALVTTSGGEAVDLNSVTLRLYPGWSD